uniref:Lymphoid-restricted membrane protein n=1 Tax=Pundamilia nyererei TaxID=303518 RepID=A0A3B4F8G5_9CICH
RIIQNLEPSAQPAVTYGNVLYTILRWCLGTSFQTKVPLFCFQAEFQRLALGFKCDMFTLEKRLRLEERSRDLAEENVRKEVSSCQGLLQALSPLCDNDNQSMEIIQRLQKNLDILIQSMTRVSSRSEMLGAIHQESRIGKAVEVMIQHVENLRRLYTKEHAELLELRETLMQNERSFGSQTEKGCTLFLRSSLSELGSKLTSLILPLKTLVQLNAHCYRTVALLSANKPRD